MAVNSAYQHLQGLKPSLPQQVDWQRRNYHDEPWYILHDKASGQFHRFNPTAYRVLAQMDGRTSLSELLANSNYLLASENEAPLDESDLVELIQYLHVADLLVCDMPASTQELFKRRQQKRNQVIQQLLINPIAWKFRLFNPEPLLEKLERPAQWLFSPLFGVFWLCVVGYALAQAGNYANTLTLINFSSWLTPANLFWLWLTYPLLKVVHELGHGLAIKAFGGQSKELGLVFIFLTPMPYVDASAATGFSHKWQRMLVSAAGILVELFLAALAFLLWLQIEDGLLKTLLLNIAILGSVSTLFFNANPLLRFDGYHILCDALEQPNLASRANRQLSYLLKRYGYGLPGLQNPARNRLESIGLSLYSLCAFIYRLVILVTIILLASQFLPILGGLLACWFTASQLLWPLIKHLHQLSTSEQLENKRSRALFITASLAILGLGIVFLLPLPQHTRAEGIIWLNDQAQIKTAIDGFIDTAELTSGTQVQQGDPLIQLQSPELDAQIEALNAQVKEYQARFDLAYKDDRAEAALFRQDLQAIEQELLLLRERQASLTLTAKHPGIWLDQYQHWHHGQFIAKGTQMGLVIPNRTDQIRLVIEQHEIGMVLDDSSAIEVRLAGSRFQNHQAQLSLAGANASYQLPSPLLGSQGGGRIAVDTDDSTSLRPIFVLDLTLENSDIQGRFGERAYIRIAHSPETLFSRAERWLQQTFIKSLEP